MKRRPSKGFTIYPHSKNSLLKWLKMGQNGRFPANVFSKSLLIQLVCYTVCDVVSPMRIRDFPNEKTSFVGCR